MEIKINTVYHGDCRDLMKAMIEQGIVADWCIADPPYGIGEDGAKNETRSSHNIAPTKFTHKDWDKERITKDYFDLMRTCSKNQIIFGGNYYSDFLPSPFGNNFAVWDKRSGNKNRNDFSDCEVAWCSTGGGAHVSVCLGRNGARRYEKQREENTPNTKTRCTYNNAVKLLYQRRRFNH